MFLVSHITRALGILVGFVSVGVLANPTESGVAFANGLQETLADSRIEFIQRILMVDSEQYRQVGKGNTWHRLAYLSGVHFLGGSYLNSGTLVCRSRLSFSGGS